MKRMLTRNNLSLWAWCLIGSVAVFANCQTRAFEPVAIVPEDMCSYCKMAISEKQYAAELIDNEGQPFKFDDIGCMLNFIKQRSVSFPAASLFVMDFDRRQWIKADSAYYVRSSELTTPMNGGIIAFEDQSKAEEAVERYHGKLLSFKEL
ncbi:MAG TPA: nitrous oxide reductase accessory protein NosL [Pyrinomonadaceae bacterium]